MQPWRQMSSKSISDGLIGTLAAKIFDTDHGIVATPRGWLVFIKVCLCACCCVCVCLRLYMTLSRGCLTYSSYVQARA